MSEQALAERPQLIKMTAPVGNKATLEALIAMPSFQAAVKDILPDHLSVERIMKMALVASSRQPLLFKCTQSSIVQALMRSAELGLDCSGTLGLGYLVPYYNKGVNGYEAQFIPGYRGIIELAKRARPKMQIEARVVYRNDVFDFEYGLDQKLVHRPALSEQGPIDFFYCITREPGLSPEFTVMPKEEVDMIMGRSKSRDRSGKIVGPWATDYPEMGRKTVVKRHAKYLALSTEVQMAANIDDEQYRPGTLTAVDSVGGEAAAKVGISAMKDRMKLVGNGGDREPETEPEPEPQEVVGDDQYVDEPIEVEPLEEEPAEPNDPEYVEPDAEVEPVDQAIAADDEAEIKLFELRKHAVERYRELEHEDRDAYLACVKWLGAKSLTELDTKKLNEFFKKFG